MKQIYYQLFDRTKKPENLDFATFGHQSCVNDFAGLVTDMARRNGSSPEDIRLFIFPTRRQWESARLEWLHKVEKAAQQRG